MAVKRKKRSSTYEKKLFFNGTFDELLNLSIGKVLIKEDEKQFQMANKSPIEKWKIN